MKFMHKVILSLVAIIVLVPASMQANGLTRILAQNVTKQAAKQLLKNPGVIMLGLGAASWYSMAKNNQKARQFGGMTATDSVTRKQYRQQARIAKKVAIGLFGFAGNYFLLTHLNKLGYLPKYKINMSRTFRGVTTHLGYSGAQAQFNMGALGFIGAGLVHNQVCGDYSQPVDAKTKLLRAITLEAAAASLVYACLG